MTIGAIAASHGGQTTLFSETWTGTNGTAWNATRWPNVRPACTIDTNRGVLTASNPGQAYCSLTVTDFEATVKMQWESTIGSQFPEIVWRIGANVSSGTGSNGYAMQVTGTTGRVDLYTVAAYTSFANATDATLNAIGTRWFKVRVVGNRHQVKWWTVGNSEPGTWQLDATDSTYTSGAFGLRTYGGTNLEFDDLTITTP